MATDRGEAVIALFTIHLGRPDLAIDKNVEVGETPEEYLARKALPPSCCGNQMFTERLARQFWCAVCGKVVAQ